MLGQSAQQTEGGLKRQKEVTTTAGPCALHESVVHELQRLGVTTRPLARSPSSSASAGLPAAFEELNSFGFPSDLFESERWDLKDVELRGWWALSSRGGGRPCVEFGSAKKRSTDDYVYFVLPTDTADPSRPGTVTA